MSLRRNSDSLGCSALSVHCHSRQPLAAVASSARAVSLLALNLSVNVGSCRTDSSSMAAIGIPSLLLARVFLLEKWPGRHMHVDQYVTGRLLSSSDGSTVAAVAERATARPTMAPNVQQCILLENDPVSKYGYVMFNAHARCW